MASDDDEHPRKKVKVTMVDHTYHDYSQLDIQDTDEDTEGGKDGLQSTQRKGIENFPAKLHKILSCGRYRDIIAWKEHGRSWIILDKERLSNEVCPQNFSHSNFDSFNRSVNGWGFKRLMREGADHKSYYHECFLRGRPDLTQFMTRLVNPGKRIPDPNGEPNFYKMAKEFPLPLDPEPEPEPPSGYPQGPFMGYPGMMPSQPGMPYYSYGYPQGSGMLPPPQPYMSQAGGSAAMSGAAGYPPHYNPYPYPLPGMPGMPPHPGMPGVYPPWPQYPQQGMLTSMPPPQQAYPYPQTPYGYPGQGGMSPMQQQMPMQGQPAQPPQSQWGQQGAVPPGTASVSYPNPYGHQSYPTHPMAQAAISTQQQRQMATEEEEQNGKSSANKGSRKEIDKESLSDVPTEEQDDQEGDDQVNKSEEKEENVDNDQVV